MTSLLILSAKPADPNRSLRELCQRIHGGAPAAAAAKIPLDWSGRRVA